MRWKPWARVVVPWAFGYFHRPTACHADSKYHREFVKGSAAVSVPRNWLCRVLDHDLHGPCPADNGGKLYTCTRCGYKMVWGGRLPVIMERGKKLEKLECFEIYESSHLFGDDRKTQED